MTGSQQDSSIHSNMKFFFSSLSDQRWLLFFLLYYYNRVYHRGKGHVLAFKEGEDIQGRNKCNCHWILRESFFLLQMKDFIALFRRGFKQDLKYQHYLLIKNFQLGWEGKQLWYDGRGIPRGPRATRMGTGLSWGHQSGTLRSPS